MPAKKLGIMCGKITQRKICQRLAPMDRGAREQDRLDVLHAGHDGYDDGKMPWLTPNAILTH
jgi:hypothetical protein